MEMEEDLVGVLLLCFAWKCEVVEMSNMKEWLIRVKCGSHGQTLPLYLMR